MNYTREIAGIFVGVGSLMLIWKGEYVAAVGLLGTMVGFFVGERNGQRKSIKEQDQGKESSN